jgi:Rho family protein
VLDRCPGVPIILVGLKKDLRDDPVAQEEMRKRSEKFLTAEEGEDVRKRISAKKYLECSSLTGEGVDDVFEALDFGRYHARELDFADAARAATAWCAEPA